MPPKKNLGKKEPSSNKGSRSNNGNKDEVTPSGSVTPDRTIFKPGQGQSEAQMVPPLQSDPDHPILIQQVEVASEITGKKAS